MRAKWLPSLVRPRKRGEGSSNTLPPSLHLFLHLREAESTMRPRLENHSACTRPARTRSPAPPLLPTDCERESRPRPRPSNRLTPPRARTAAVVVRRAKTILVTTYSGRASKQAMFFISNPHGYATSSEPKTLLLLMVLVWSAQCLDLLAPQSFNLAHTTVGCWLRPAGNDTSAFLAREYSNTV